MSQMCVINWIPVSERLPDVTYGQFLITVKIWSDIIDSWINNRVMVDKFNLTRFDIERYCIDEAHKPVIKAWAELPKPYGYSGLLNDEKCKTCVHYLDCAETSQGICLDDKYRFYKNKEE